MPEDPSGSTPGDLDVGDGVSKMVMDAIAMHEVLTSLMKAGWTERQAIIYLVELGHRRRDE